MQDSAWNLFDGLCGLNSLKETGVRPYRGRYTFPDRDAERACQTILRVI